MLHDWRQERHITNVIVRVNRQRPKEQGVGNLIRDLVRIGADWRGLLRPKEPKTRSVVEPRRVNYLRQVRGIRFAKTKSARLRPPAQCNGMISNGAT